MLLNQIVEATRRFISGRQGAYRRTFNLESRDADVVLQDLARFCRAHASTASTDPYMAARLDGRREVFLRISQHLQLDERTLWMLYGGPQLKGD